MAKGAFVLVLLLVALLASAGVAWWRFLARKQPDGSIWRRRLFLLGLAVNTLSVLLFSAFTLQAILISKGVLGSADLIASYRVFLPLELSLAAVICGAFGKRIPRILVILSGLLLSFLWLNYGAISL
jgi:hypothetical protein